MHAWHFKSDESSCMHGTCTSGRHPPGQPSRVRRGGVIARCAGCQGGSAHCAGCQGGSARCAGFQGRCADSQGGSAQGGCASVQWPVQCLSPSWRRWATPGWLQGTAHTYMAEWLQGTAHTYMAEWLHDTTSSIHQCIRHSPCKPLNPKPLNIPRAKP